MKIDIHYKLSGKTQLFSVRATVPWTAIAEYKINHPDRSDEVVMEEIAKILLHNLVGGKAKYFSWQKVED